MDAWTIKAWPTVLSPQAELFCASFKHMSTKVQDPHAKPGKRAGQTLWVSRSGPRVAIAWDWAEVEPLVVVVSDPMAILTNACLKAGTRDPVEDDGETVVAVNSVVHRLPWQRIVRRHLSELRGGGRERVDGQPYH